MKIKIEVDVNQVMSDLFGEAYCHDSSVDLDIQETVKRDIIHQTKTEVLKQVTKGTFEQMTKLVKAMVEFEYEDKIATLVDARIAEGKIQGNYSNNPDVTIAEYVDAQLKSANRSGILNKAVDRQVSKAITDIKQRYDMLFASQVVAKMNEQGLLKEGVFESIMEKK